MRYGRLNNLLEVFLGSMGSASLRPRASSSPLGINDPLDLPGESPYWFEPGQPSPGWPTLLRHPITQTLLWRYRNINLFPITYAFQPRLRGRLTLSGLTFLRKPWVSGEGVSHPFYRYSCRHPHFRLVHLSFRSGFNLTRNAPLPIRRDESRPIPQLRW